MKNDQYSTPVIVRDGTTTVLQRLPFSERHLDENWLQELLFENRSILPFPEFEPAFAGSIPIVRELPTGAGPVDLLFVNSKGYISLVETKLWRNPEARRAVVAQIIDYAKDMAGWSYDSLLSAIKKASKRSSDTDPLIGMFSEIEGEDFDQRMFIDRVTRNLQLGRFLLLIVGDGIQEGVEQMASFIQQTPHLGYTLALVEIAVYREHPESNRTLYIQPKILARTREITRAIVELKIPANRSDVVVSLPREPKPSSGRRRIAEDEFLEELQKSSGSEAVDFARWVLEHAEDHGLRIDWKDAGPLLKYDDPASGEFFTLGQLHKNGNFTETYRLYGRFENLGWPFDACRDHLDEVASLIPGASRRAFESKSGSGNKWEQVAYGKHPTARSHPPFLALASRRTEWFDAIYRVVSRIQALSGDEE